MSGLKSVEEKVPGGALPHPEPNAVASALGVDAITIDWLAGDGSDRCYYRIASPELSKSFVLMQLSEQDAKALKRNDYDWVQLGGLLASHDILIPRVIVPMRDYAALIIEDYGNRMLETLVQLETEKGNWEPVLAAYDIAFVICRKFLSISPKSGALWCQRSFDKDRLLWELDFFVQKYLDPIAKTPLTSIQQRQLKKEFVGISTEIAQHAKHFVHRDFHSRNLMVQNEKLAVIDFQDARLGPAAYDIVSLCFDSYVPFSPKVRLDLLDRAIATVKMTKEAAGEEIENTWKIVLLQRQLKAIGSFGYLTTDKQKGDYLKYVNPALQILLDADIEDSRWPFVSGELIHLLLNPS